MSSVYFNTSCDAVSETSPNTTYGDESFDANALSTEGYQGSIVYYQAPSYYYVYNVVTPVEMNGATFYYYSAYATPFYTILLDDLNSVSNVSSHMDAVSRDFDLSHLFEEDENNNNILLDDLYSVSNVSSDMDAVSPDFDLSHLLEEDGNDNNILLDDLNSVSTVSPDMDAVSPDFDLSLLFEEDEEDNNILLDDLNSVSNVSPDMDAVSPDFDLSLLFEEDEEDNNILLDDLNSVSNVSSDMDAVSPDFDLSHLLEEDENDKSILLDDLNSVSNVSPDMDAVSPDFDLSLLFEEDEEDNNILLDDLNSVSNVSPDMDAVSPDFDLSLLFEEDEEDNNKLRIREPVVDAISLTGEEGKENNLLSDKSEEMLDSTNASVELSREDVSPRTDKCHGDYDKKFGNDAVIKLLSDSINENTSQKESSEGNVDNWEFLEDLSFDNVEDQEFKIEASYCGPSENEFLGQSSSNDLDEDTFNSPFPSRKVFKKLRYFKREIEVLPTIYEEDEPPEDDEDLPEAIDEVVSSKNPKKQRFKRLRRWFSQLTSCCRKNKKPPD